MAAKRFTGTKINWPSILERYPFKENAQMAELLSLKKTHEAYLRRLTVLPEKAPAIDWATYKAKIPIAGFVDGIKQKYEAISVPYPKSNVDSLIDAREKEASAGVAQIKQENLKAIEKLKEEIKALDNKLPIEQMTWQEFKQAYPEMGPSVTHPTPWPHDDLETNREWRLYLDAKAKGLPAPPRPS